MLEQTYLCDDEEGFSPIETFNCMKLTVANKSRTISAPVETGQMVFDNKVIDPSEIHLSGIVVNDDNRDETVHKIEEMFQNRKFQFYSITTYGKTYYNLMMKDCNRILDKDQPDFIMFDLVFMEVLLVQNQEYTPANPANTDTQKSGNMQGKATSGEEGMLEVARILSQF